VSAFDGSSFIAGWIVLLVITLVAALVPLRRAVQIDPVVLLRSE